jgi:hypothetical protein
MKQLIWTLGLVVTLPVAAHADYEIPSDFREMTCIFQAGDVPERTIPSVDLRRIAGDIVWIEDGTSPLPVAAVVVAGVQTTIYAPTTKGASMLTILSDGTARVSRHWFGRPDLIPCSALSGTCAAAN